jgi:hypothetical protein
MMIYVNKHNIDLSIYTNVERKVNTLKQKLQKLIKFNIKLNSIMKNNHH